MKTRIGILFGGSSKEREISFAGGRTVYDNLNKTLFEAIPIFLDNQGNFIELEWELVYKGSIRDFYPSPVRNTYSEFPLYAESIIQDDATKATELAASIGKILSIQELKSKIDIAFLALHGPNGEDGRLQGLLEFYNIPYTGSGIFSSAIGIDKILQKKLASNYGFQQPSYFTITRKDWLQKNTTSEDIITKILQEFDFPFVVKAPTQGSSIGISIVIEDSNIAVEKAIDKAFFIRTITHNEWTAKTEKEKTDYTATLVDIREGIGLPVRINKDIYYIPEDVIAYLDGYFSQPTTDILLEGLDTESEIIVEEFIQGKEFSAIVIEDTQGNPICLPPTEIRKGKELFDYRSKYLPGLSRKITPIDLPDKDIHAIRKATCELFKAFQFGVYARIDGFITAEGIIYLNDPNTTSGMMPSSFFFHQAAEIGLNPSQFLTYIIHISLKRRLEEFKYNGIVEPILQQLEKNITELKTQSNNKKKIGVILGGYSSERHISVESGRNIFEKLASSEKYAPIPLFLHGNDTFYSVYHLPINVLLKDNADDIWEKVRFYEQHPIITQIIKECTTITNTYTVENQLFKPVEYEIEELQDKVDMVFIALHGRPGEDGNLQARLDAIKMPYNGSSSATSAITIDKYDTTEILMKAGFLAANHKIVTQEAWNTAADTLYKEIEQVFTYPFIAKPVDDGCSSAVKKIKNREELHAFSQLIFRTTESLLPEPAHVLHIQPKEEFPQKNRFLIESLISANGASIFLEVTGGMLCHQQADGSIGYEMFEASESLAEGDVLSLEEKFLAGQGMNITPARYATNPTERQRISDLVKQNLQGMAQAIGVTGYCRIDAFVRVYEDGKVEVICIEINSLPGMTPATCIFHQCAINHYKPYEFIDKIIEFGVQQKQVVST